jgi:kinetochore protein Spc25
MAPGTKPSSRLPKFDLVTLITQANPSIDLKLDDYHSKSSEFLHAVTDYTGRATTEISQRRQAHAAEKNRLADKSQVIEQETGQYKLAELELLATIEREKEETKQAEAAVQSLQRENTSIQSAAAMADAEIEQYRAQVKSLRRGASACCGCRLACQTQS